MRYVLDEKAGSSSKVSKRADEHCFYSTILPSQSRRVGSWTLPLDQPGSERSRLTSAVD